MLRATSELGSFKAEVAKFRKFTHRFSPRELSPTRLLEKMGTDQKKKAVKKIATMQVEADTHKAANEALLQKQLAVLDAAVPPSVVAPFDAPQSPAILPFADPAPVPVASVAAPSMLVKAIPWLLGAGALAILLRKRS